MRPTHRTQTCTHDTYIARDGTTIYIAGVIAEMAYIKNGEVNAYTLRFPYRIATNVTKLTFSWNSTESHDVSDIAREL